MYEFNTIYDSDHLVMYRELEGRGKYTWVDGDDFEGGGRVCMYHADKKEGHGKMLNNGPLRLYYLSCHATCPAAAREGPRGSVSAYHVSCELDTPDRPAAHLHVKKDVRVVGLVRVELIRDFSDETATVTCGVSITIALIDMLPLAACPNEHQCQTRIRR